MPSTQQQGYAVRCRRVTKRFGHGEAAVEALRGVDLEVPYGRLLLLEGPSGSGKTTLLSVIGGLLRPDDGDVHVFGNRLGKLSGRQLVDLRRERVGFVFQEFNLLPALSAAENAAVPSIIAGQSRRQATRRARELLDRMELGHRAGALPGKLSGGEKQRVAIARALIHEPRLILCDEPTASLDTETGQTIMTLLYNSVNERRAVIVVTHDPRVYEFSDRVATIEDGRITRTRSSTERRSMNHQ